MIRVAQLPASDVRRIAEIDRSEQVRVGYTYLDGRLVAEDVDWQVPPWLAEGDGPDSAAAMIAFCARHVEQGGVLLGALDGERLAGVAVLRPRLTQGLAQLAFLHVSRPYRRQGIARRLTEEVCRLARADGAQAVYVSATPSESAVGFYLSQGFRPTDEPHPDLLALEPEDIHMVKPL
jgi:ribosomal protein S18 acetylase RimI-like enzyme